MRLKRQTPLAAVANGVLAGIVGTLAMDLVWYRRYRRGGGTDRFTDWEFSSGLESYENAPAPAQVGKRLVEGFLQTELKPQSAALTNNAMHWTIGIAWGAFHGLLVGSTKERRVRYGLGTGAIAWATSYATLAPAKLYQPMWKYPPSVLGKDLSAHLVYGLGTATAFRLLSSNGSSAEG